MEQQPDNDDEISLLDIITFLRDSWKVISAAGLLGMLGAGGYLAVTQSLYEARLQIEMAQVRNNNNNNNNNINPIGINIEDPNLLAERLNLPSTYPEDTLRACGLQDRDDFKEDLTKQIKAAPMKKVGTVIEASIRRPTPVLASACGQAIFEMIRDQQAAIPRLAAEGSQQTLPTRLVSPIYVAPKPVYPRQKLVLALGMLLGLMLGLIFAIGRRVVIESGKK